MIRKNTLKSALCALMAALLLLCCGCGKAVETAATGEQIRRETSVSQNDISSDQNDRQGAKTAKADVKTASQADADTNTEAASDAETEASAAQTADSKTDSSVKGSAADTAAQTRTQTQTAQKTTSGTTQAQSGASSSGSTDTQTSADKTCTISISCSTVLGNMDLCKESKKSIVPSDGIILAATTVSFSDGETVFDVLQRVCRSKGISLESSWSPVYNSAYIEGIANLYEFDVGNGSGWMYKVNGTFPNYGCSSYTLTGGENICWVYTCDLGSDVGGGY